MNEFLQASLQVFIMEKEAKKNRLKQLIKEKAKQMRVLEIPQQKKYVKSLPKRQQVQNCKW